jgi:hypothetical protein
MGSDLEFVKPVEENGTIYLNLIDKFHMDFLADPTEKNREYAKALAQKMNRYLNEYAKEHFPKVVHEKSLFTSLE